MTPSRIRNRMESRVRRLAASYPVATRILACRELEQLAREYREHLERKGGGEDGEGQQQEPEASSGGKEGRSDSEA